MTTGKAILELHGISKRFPGVQALDDVSMEIRRGEIHSIVGENGAGKSTLTKIVTGIHQRDAGTVVFDGKQVAYRSITQSIEDAIYLVFQELSLCANLTVAENIYLGKLGLALNIQTGIVNRRALYRQAREHLAGLNLHHLDVSATVGDLEIAQQQLVEIAKALVLKPKLLILDEPTSALNSDEVQNLFALINRLRDEGVTILLISHIIEDVYAISDSITVLRDGRHVITKPKAEFDVDEIVRLMVGREVQQVEIGTLDSEEELLRVEGLENHLLRQVSLTLHKGEILGLMGLQGSGTAELLRCIYGKSRYTGQVHLEGRQARIRHSRNAIGHGIVYVPADRKTEGLLDTLDIGFNLAFLNLPRLQSFGLVRKRRVYAQAARLADQLRLKHSGLDRSPFTLSGGNQQKVVIGKAISVDPRIVLLDDPTRGVDIGAKHELYKIMLELAESGRGILLLSTELPELLSLCHRVLVFFGGRVVGEHSRADATEEKLVAEACGLADSGKR